MASRGAAAPVAKELAGSDTVCRSLPTVAGVTGATGTIGKAMARLIAHNHNYEVVLLCRNEAKASDAVREIKKATGNDRVRYELLDVSRRSSIESLAARWEGPLHILINNAAATPRTRLETPEGIELQFATNVLGYFWLTEAFCARLAASAPARVINVASYWAGGLDLKDPEFRYRPYDNDQAYRQSKQADRMLTVALARRMASLGVTVNACHPGDANSTLSNNLGFGGHESPEDSAATPVWLATHRGTEMITGRYFEYQRETRCRFGEDSKAVEALYELCQSY